MKILPCRDAAEVAARCADLVAEVVRERSDAVLVLPAGNTPRPLFAELVRRQAAGLLDLSRARVVQLDELVGVGPSDPRSFRSFLREHLLGPLGREDAQDLLLDGTAPDPDREIERHAAALLALGPPDLAVLGIGRNGHVAFNEPGTRREDGARRLALAPDTRASQAKVFAPEPAPTEGLTLGLRELRSARRVRVLATGDGKRAVLRRLLGEPASSDLPASLLEPHADLALWADEAACADLADLV